MLIKVSGILTIVCCNALKMPFNKIGREVMLSKTTAIQRPQLSKSLSTDTINRRNMIYVKDIKYTHDGDSVTFAHITIKNTFKETITDIAFFLDGHIPKGCNKSYEVKQKMNLKPNQAITLSQRLAKDDCEVHVIKNIRIRFTIDINFTLD